MVGGGDDLGKFGEVVKFVKIIGWTADAKGGVGGEGFLFLECGKLLFEVVHNSSKNNID